MKESSRGDRKYEINLQGKSQKNLNFPSGYWLLALDAYSAPQFLKIIW